MHAFSLLVTEIVLHVQNNDTNNNLKNYILYFLHCFENGLQIAIKDSKIRIRSRKERYELLFLQQRDVTVLNRISKSAECANAYVLNKYYSHYEQNTIINADLTLNVYV